MSTIILVFFVVVFLAIFIGVFWHRRRMSFTGTVTDKDIHEDVVPNNSTQGVSLNNNVQHTYVVKIQTDAGKSIIWNVSQGKYELLKIGDRVGKKSGSTDLEITPQTATPPTPTA